ncbi:MAG: hypothetical protein C7B46_02205 [Sulfobacillus benefaciens]|uniref:MFS transporter n=1 Tax=Sulfobacillus benefaciens TaxID=453960 RepID=A0A2T2XKI1_9FIRM|nr:MAG: hypothetical protein C7B46_02205 [Sulfobacillus benefaciens]
MTKALRRLLPELPVEVWWVIGVNTAMSIIFNFVSIFVNLYWWNQGNAIFLVSLFNLASTIALFTSYLLGSHFLYRFSIRHVMVYSGVFAGLSFGALYFYNGAFRDTFGVVVGLMFGAAQGFFWAANNASMYTFLKSEQYADYFSVNTVIAQGIAVMVPLISAGIVAGIGFKGSFIIMLVFVGAGIGVSMKLPYRGLEQSLFAHIGPKEIFSKPGTKWAMVVVFCAGLVNQFLALFSMIYIFTVSNNVGFVAFLNIGYSLVLVGALILYRRIGFSQDTWLIVGSLLILASYLIALASGHTAWNTVVVLLMRVGGLYFTGASGRQRYRVIMQGDVVWRTRLGLWMEIPFMLSRTIILTGALLVHSVGDGNFIALAILSGLAMFSLPIFMRFSIRQYEAVQGIGTGL